MRDKIEMFISKDMIINVYHAKSGKIIPLPLEEYILCVTAGEMPAAYGLEALKAQAVCARTYTVYKIQKGGCKDFNADICTSSSHCQAYCDISAMQEKWGVSFDKYFNKVSLAVKETKGEIMVYRDKPIEAMYHASSGGITEDSGNVYKNKLPYLKSVVSEGEESYSKFYGTKELTADTFVNILNENAKTVELENLSIDHVARFLSGRVDYVVISGIKITGKEMRKYFNLNSTNFSMSVSVDKVEINTKGYGHGVGLSQAGANVFAKKGVKYPEILNHYFSGIELSLLNDIT